MTTFYYRGKEFTNRGTDQNPIYHIPASPNSFLNKWESGWTSVDSDSVTTFTHNLGTSDVIVQAFLAEDGNGLNQIQLQAREYQAQVVSSALIKPYSGQIQSIDSNSVEVQVYSLSGSYWKFTAQPDATVVRDVMNYNYSHLMVRVTISTMLDYNESATVAIPSDYSLSYTREIISTTLVPFKNFTLNRGTEYRTTVLYTVPLPKPAGFTAGGRSVGVQVNFNHIGNHPSYPVYLYSSSGVSSSITMTSGDSSKSYANTSTSDIPGVPSVFSAGQRWYQPKFGDGYYITVDYAKITYTHPYGMLYYQTSGEYYQGRAWNSGNGKLILLPFYDYDNDTPAMAYIGDEVWGTNLNVWGFRGHLANSTGNFASPNRCWLGGSVTLHPGGNDPHWNHTQYGVTQRNPGGYA